MSILERVPVDQIGARARTIRPGPALAALALLPLFALGWTARWVCVIAWVALSWGAAAIKTGWQEAGAKASPPSR